MSAEPVPDRAGVRTEGRNPRTMALHRASVRECLDLLNAEDQRAAAAVGEAGGALASLIEAIEPRFLAGGRLVYLGAGTSGRLGVLDASECPPTFQTDPSRVVGIIAGGDSALRRSSEGLEDDPDGACPGLDALALTPRDSVVGVAAGGTTPYVLGGLRIARDAGALTCLLTCSPPDAQDEEAHPDHLVLLDTGPEAITGSTRMKAGSATKMALNAISTTLMVRAGKVHENLMVDLRATNAKLRDRAARIVMTLTGLEREEAFALLDRAGGGVKAAVVMHRLDVDRDAAEARLRDAGGRLDAALGER